MTWDNDLALKKAFRAILEKYGDLSADRYDAIKDDSKPPRRTLRRRKGGMDWADLKAWAMSDDLDTTEPKDERTYGALIAQTKMLKSNLDKSRDIAATIIECCVAEIAKLRIKPVSVPLKKSVGENLEFHCLRSDAQVGQYTDEAWTQGVSQYDSQIYRERVQRLTEKISLFKHQDSSSLGLNKLIIYHLGDQVEGEGIFRGQSFALDLSGVEQLFYSVEVECSFILAMAHIFPEVEVYCVPGNHGRPGRKGDNHPKTNFDYVFYRIMQITLRGQDNVKFYISESPSMLIQQGIFVFLLNHGDMAKSWNGIPYYGLDRAAKKVNDLFGMIIHYNLCGHHHTPCNMADHIIMNGCLPGGSDFSVNGLLAASRPSQKIFYFHPQFGINRESNLYLADPVRLEADERGIFTSYV
jgi:hypothetical protein